MEIEPAVLKEIPPLLRAEDVEDCRGLARGREGETLAGGTRGEVGGERGGPAFASSKPTGD